LGRNEYIRGGNIAIKKSALERLGGFRTDLGMRGDVLGYGEETQLQERLRRREPGALILYRPDAAVRHVVRPEKMTLRWQARRAWRQGWQASRIYDPDAFGAPGFRRIRALAKAAVHGVLAVSAMLGSPFRSRRAYRYWRTYVMLRVLPHLYSTCAHASFALRRRASEAA